MNHKDKGLNKARQQFRSDLQTDKDYIEFKQNCSTDTHYSYGCVKSYESCWLLNRGYSCETLIAMYLKEIKNIKK